MYGIHLLVQYRIVFNAYAELRPNGGNVDSAGVIHQTRIVNQHDTGSDVLLEGGRPVEELKVYLYLATEWIQRKN